MTQKEVLQILLTIICPNAVWLFKGDCANVTKHTTAIKP